MHFLSSFHSSQGSILHDFETQDQSQLIPSHPVHPPPATSTPTHLILPTPTTPAPTCSLTPLPPPVPSPSIEQSETVSISDPHAGKKIHAYINVNIPQRTEKTRQKRLKVVKDTLVLGPVSVPNDVAHMQLMEIIAGSLDCMLHDVDANSMLWKPQKPANAKYLPLRDEAGVNGMLSMVLGKAKRDTVIFIDLKVDPPRISKPVLVCCTSIHYISSISTYILTALERLKPTSHPTRSRFFKPWSYCLSGFRKEPG